MAGVLQGGDRWPNRELQERNDSSSTLKLFFVYHDSLPLSLSLYHHSEIIQGTALWGTLSLFSFDFTFFVSRPVFFKNCFEFFRGSIPVTKPETQPTNSTCLAADRASD